MFVSVCGCEVQAFRQDGSSETLGTGVETQENTKKEGSTNVMCASHSSIGSKLRVKIPMFDELMPQGYCCALTNDEVESANCGLQVCALQQLSSA